MTETTRRIVETVASIPPGRVATYGGIAAAAGVPRGARQVARVLHAVSAARGLPWHRVVNHRGGISLDPDGGGELQRKLLESEGVEFDDTGRIDLGRFGYFVD
jgi:methylated-DNA-protein-cysteine methyltransferase related protein